LSWAGFSSFLSGASQILPHTSLPSLLSTKSIALNKAKTPYICFVSIDKGYDVFPTHRVQFLRLNILGEVELDVSLFEVMVVDLDISVNHVAAICVHLPTGKPLPAPEIVEVQVVAGY
jgi:hypothetical protein